MNNLQRLELETKGITMVQDELFIYFQENDLQPKKDKFLENGFYLLCLYR